MCNMFKGLRFRINSEQRWDRFVRNCKETFARHIWMCLFQRGWWLRRYPVRMLDADGSVRVPLSVDCHVYKIDGPVRVLLSANCAVHYKIFVIELGAIPEAGYYYCGGYRVGTRYSNSPLAHVTARWIEGAIERKWVWFIQNKCRGYKYAQAPPVEFARPADSV